MKSIFLLLAFALPLQPVQASGFVQVRDGHFVLDSAPYRFVGANFWYAMNLDSARLDRELDRLKNLGLTNLRVMGATEGPDSEPWRITPSLQPRPGFYDPSQIAGLDRLFAGMRSRGMKAVVILNNFWPWSGGMAQYLAWNGAGTIPYPPPATGGTWDGFQTFTARFYSNAGAVSESNDLVRFLVTRYAQEPAIMSWELANEPRGDVLVADFHQWIANTSALIKSIDPNHLVTTGSEGQTPWPAANGLDIATDHSASSIDYVTTHIWAQNWSWYDPTHPETTYADAVGKMGAYFDDAVSRATGLQKPLVIEEFGLARDNGSFDPSSTTAYRDRYFSEVFSRAQNTASVAGVSFWAWAGEARPMAPFGGIWKAGNALIGDPPHEAQGWYSVYDSDQSTLNVIQGFVQSFAKTLALAPKPDQVLQNLARLKR